MIAIMERDILARYRIQDLIKKEGITQRIVAGRIGMPYATFLNYMQGRTEMTVPFLESTARALNTMPEALIAAEVVRSDIATAISEHIENLSEDDKEEVLEFVKLKERRLREKQDAYRADAEADSKKSRTRLSGSQSKAA